MSKRNDARTMIGQRKSMSLTNDSADALSEQLWDRLADAGIVEGRYHLQSHDVQTALTGIMDELASEIGAKAARAAAGAFDDPAEKKAIREAADEIEGGYISI